MWSGGVQILTYMIQKVVKLNTVVDQYWSELLGIGIFVVIQELNPEIQDQIRYSKFVLRGEVSTRNKKTRDTVRVGTKQMNESLYYPTNAHNVKT
jgi:hypothetical protein